MAIPAPTKTDIVNSIWRSLATSTNYTGSRTEGIIPALVEAFATEQSRWWGVLRDLEQQSSVFTASGVGLDALGANLGVTRRPSLAANTYGSVPSIKFTNSGGSEVTIPGGTRLWSKDYPQTAFFTVEGITLTAGTSGFVHARASEIGESYNVPINYINRHSGGVAGVTVTNVLGIGNGSSVESDGAYRERLIRSFQSRYTFNANTCDALLRGIPGIKDVLIVEKTGAFDAIVVPNNLTETSTVVEIAQNILDENTPIGVRPTALGPVLKLVDVSVTLTFVAGAQGREEIRSLIKSQIASLIEALPIETGQGGSFLYVEQLKGIVNSTDRSISSGVVTLRINNSLPIQTGTIRAGFGEKFTPGVVLVQ